MGDLKLDYAVPEVVGQLGSSGLRGVHLIVRKEGTSAMKAAKVALIVVAIILAFPVGFALIYAFQAGCLLCFEGRMAGSWQESALNIALLILVAAGLIWAVAKRRSGN